MTAVQLFKATRTEQGYSCNFAMSAEKDCGSFAVSVWAGMVVSNLLNV